MRPGLHRVGSAACPCGCSRGLRRPCLRRAGSSSCEPCGPDCTLGLVAWGPESFNETDSSTNQLPPHRNLVKSIPIDFSELCSDAGTELQIEFLSGQITYGESGFLEIRVGGTATGYDGVSVWFSSEEFGSGPDWTSIFPFIALVPIDSFVNPNPAGTSWVKFFTYVGGTFNPCNCSGIRNYQMQITVVAA